MAKANDDKVGCLWVQVREYDGTSLHFKDQPKHKVGIKHLYHLSRISKGCNPTYTATSASDAA